MQMNLDNACMYIIAVTIKKKKKMYIIAVIDIPYIGCFCTWCNRR